MAERGIHTSKGHIDSLFSFSSWGKKVSLFVAAQGYSSQDSTELLARCSFDFVSHLVIFHFII